LESFSKNAQILKFMKIRVLGAEFFHAEKRTDGHDEANVAVGEFAQASKTVSSLDHRSRRKRMSLPQGF
jgi:hypothetical protein